MVAFRKKNGYTKQEFLAKLASRFSMHIPKQLGLDTISWGRKFLPSYYTHAPNKMHRWLSKRFEKFDQRGQKVGVIGPRGNAKSVLGNTTLILQRALERREHNILICSDTAMQAREHLRSIKDELDSNEQIHEEYPDAAGVGPIWRDDKIQLKNGVVIRAVGTLSRIRGIRKRQIRPSLIVIDDPENDTHIESQIMRNRTRVWLERTILSLGDTETNFLAMGTALHREGLINHIVRMPGVTTLRMDGKIVPFRSIIEWPDYGDLWDRWEGIYYDVDDPDHLEKAERFFKKHKKKMLKGASVLWPEREDLYHLMELRATIGHTAFEAEKQGNPINPETVEWPEEYFQDIWFHEWPKQDMLKIVACDPSKGRDAKRGDYSAIGRIGVSASGMFYVEADLDRRSTDKLIGDIANHCHIFGAHELSIETNQYQELLADEVMRELELRRVGVNIHELDNRVKKEVRIRRLSPLLAQRRIKFKSESRGTTLLVNQLRDFPNGEHDDGPDMLEMATRTAADILEEDRPQDNLHEVESLAR